MSRRGAVAAAAPAALLIGALLPGCGATSRSAVPPDVVVEKSEQYVVDGASSQELRWAMDRLGPPNAEGSRSPAVTKWDFEYTFGLSEKSGRCRMSTLETRTTITTVLPRWTPGATAAPALVRHWNAWVECAALHEAGHKRIYLDGLADFRRRAGEVGEFATCEQATAAIDALAQDVRRVTDTAQSDYERRTNHGDVQCGRFE